MSKSISFDNCEHSRVRHSPDGINIIEECHDCHAAWQIMGITGEVIKLAATWMDRVIDREKAVRVKIDEIPIRKTKQKKGENDR